MAIRLLDNVPAKKMGYVIAYLQGITADFIEDKDDDDAFCEQLLKEYEADPDKGEYVTAEEMAKMCGVDLNDLYDHI